MHASLAELPHRPWPLPAGAWRWRQSWCDLLFAHWRVDKDQLQPLVPAPLTVQEFDGCSWVGVVPFHMQGVMLRPLPDLPGVSAFPELNLRLYVEHNGKPGVWFLSLDAESHLAVWAARRFFHLPYHHARMQLTGLPDEVRLHSRRDSAGPEFTARYAPTSDAYVAEAGSLEHWLTERYCLYAKSPGGRVFRTEVHHPPWPLQRAEAELSPDSLLAPHGLCVDGPPELLHFSRRLDVVAWSPVALWKR
jgi:hypothetical protein